MTVNRAGRYEASAQITRVTRTSAFALPGSFTREQAIRDATGYAKRFGIASIYISAIPL